MKRPFGIYLVAFWFFLGFGSFTWSSFTRTFLPKLISNTQSIMIINVIGLAFIVYMIVGIIQIKLTQRMISIMIFTMLSIYQSYALLTFLLFEEFTKKVITIICFKAFIIVPSVICVMYLVKPRFREFASKYLEWKKQDQMQKYVHKKMMKDIGK